MLIARCVIQDVTEHGKYVSTLFSVDFGDLEQELHDFVPPCSTS